MAGRPTVTDREILDAYVRLNGGTPQSMENAIGTESYGPPVDRIPIEGE